MWRVLDIWLERIELFFFSLSAVAIAAMALLIGTDVGLRFLTGGSPGWLADGPVFLNIMMAFLAMAYVMRRRQHICVDVLLTTMSTPMRRAARIATLCIAQVFFLTLLYAGARVALRSYELGNMSYTAFEVPMFLLQSSLPLGALLLACEGLSQLAKALHGDD